MSKEFILLKELPDSKPGDKYIWNDVLSVYYKDGNVGSRYWTKEYVENNTEWFLFFDEKSVYHHFSEIIKRSMKDKAWNEYNKNRDILKKLFSESKEVKPTIQPDYEILSFKSSLGNICKLGANGFMYYYEYHGGWTLEVMLADKTNTIHSVKRLTDSQIIEVNKTHVQDLNTGHDWIVSELTVKDERCFANGVNINEKYLKIIPLPPERIEPPMDLVFTSEQYTQIWNMIFSQTGYPEGHAKHVKK